LTKENDKKKAFSKRLIKYENNTKIIKEVMTKENDKKKAFSKEVNKI